VNPPLEQAGRWVAVFVIAAFACGPDPAAAPAAESEPAVPPAVDAKPQEAGPLSESSTPRPKKSGLAATVSANVDAVKTAKSAEPTPPPVEVRKADAKRAEPEPKRAPGVLAAPTAAEFKAWDRKDPAGEKHLYEWDKANMSLMHGYFRDIECARLAMIDEGEAFVSGTHTEAQWTAHKRSAVLGLNKWQQKLFRDNPRIMEHSKYMGTLLEAHEVVVLSLPKAYNARDDEGTKLVNALWTVLMAKVSKYTTTLGGTFVAATSTDCASR